MDKEMNDVSVALRAAISSSSRENLDSEKETGVCDSTVKHDDSTVKLDSTTKLEGTDNLGESTDETIEREAQEDDDVYIPDGGTKAWVNLVGVFCGFTSCMGIVNSNGALEQYLASDVLSNESHSLIGWVFSLFNFSCFGMLILVAPIFENYGSNVCMTISICLFTVGYMSLSESTELYQFILSSIAAGFGLAFTFGTCIGVLGHYFRRRRAFCLGIGFSGGAIGGIIFPIIMRSLFSKIGFKWTIKVLGFVMIALLILGLVLMTDRRKEVLPSLSPDDSFFKKTLGRIKLSAFKNKTFAALVVGNMCFSFSFQITLTYIVSYGVAVGNSYHTATNLTVIMNATSIVGRSFGGYMADRYGRFNVLLVIGTLTIFCYLVLWVPAPISHTFAGLIVFSAVYGVALGSNISLAPSALGQISKASDFSSNYGTSSVCTSLLNLAGIPIGGAIINGGTVADYDHLVLFITGVSMAGWIAIFYARYSLVGMKLTWV